MRRSLLLMVLPIGVDASAHPNRAPLSSPEEAKPVRLSGQWNGHGRYRFNHYAPNHVHLCHDHWPASGYWNGWRLTVIWQGYVGQYEMIGGDLVGGWCAIANAEMDGEGKVHGLTQKDIMRREDQER